MYASPISITVTLSGGNFDRGVTTSGVDTGVGFTTSGASCVGAGCAGLSISSLNSLLLDFTVPSGSGTGSGASFAGSTLVQSLDLNGFFFSGQSAFNQNSSLTESIGATGVLGDAGSLTGTLALNWSGNSSVQTRAATGTITLAGDVASTPEPSTALLLSLPLVGLIALRKIRAESGQGQ